MSEEKDTSMNAKDFLIGTLVGGLVGASAALLLAPKPGKELRNDINTQARAAKESTSQFAQTISEQSSHLVEKVKDLTKSVRDDSSRLDDWDDLDGESEEIAAAVRKEVEDLQRSVEQLVREVEEQEKLSK